MSKNKKDLPSKKSSKKPKSAKDIPTDVVVTIPNVSALARWVVEASIAGGRSLEVYGVPAQTLMAVEECGELIQAVTKRARGRCSKADVLSECADVIITALTLSLSLSDGDMAPLASQIEAKVLRLQERMNSKGATKRDFGALGEQVLNNS